MNKIMIKIGAAVMTLLTVIIVSIFWFYSVIVDYSQQPLMLTEPRELNVVRGVSVNQLAQELASEGVISDVWKLKALLKFRPELANIRTGLYEMTPTETISDLLLALSQGKTKIFTVTLVEGKTIREWQQQLAALPHLIVNDDSFMQVLLAHDDTSQLPEGKFFPDTYHYVAGENVTTLLSQSFVKMQQELNEAWAARAPELPLSSPYELLTMASIIEKETGKADERDWISAVFINRLRQGMRLQTDPTVIYGMGERFDGNITRKDLIEDTPFNTYRIFGLPPTPIAAPSRASLQAAAKPADVKYVYFVSKNDGSHVFSTTLDEHNRAVNQYQRKRK